MFAERCEYRLQLANTDRGANVEHRVVLSRHPSETNEHLTLRMLTYCLLWDERLTFGPGLCDGEAPDLLSHHLTGKVSAWIACGDLSPDLARKVVQHNRDAAVHVVFSRQERREAFVEEVATWGERLPRGWDRVTVWTIDPALVAALAAREGLRHKWSVTIVGDHFYVEADGLSYEGAAVRG